MIDGGLRKLFKQNLPAFDWLPVETHFTVRGVPDSNYCHNGIEGWVEYKAVKPGAYTLPNLRPEQIGWITRRTLHGGRVFIAIRRGEELLMYAGADARALRERGLLLPHAMHCMGGPRAWDWPAISVLLTGPVSRLSARSS